MSEERWGRLPEDHDGSPVEPAPSAIDEIPPAVAAQPAIDTRPVTTFRQTALWLAALSALVIAGLALSPFWAPAVVPLLPWAAKSTPTAAVSSGLAARVAAFEERPAAPATDVEAIKSVLAAQAQRVERLEAALATDGRDQVAAAANKTALQQLTAQVAAIEAQSEAQAANKTTAAAKAEQELGRVGVATADLGDRLSVLEQRVRAQGSSDRTGTALLIEMLQMRDAVEGGRSFSAAYSAFTSLARDDPALIAGAAPLAGAARDGVTSRATLRRQLVDLADKVARADKPSGKLKWWEQAFDRIKRLVTIRRIGGAPRENPEAAISAAQSALATDDLSTAVSALAPLDGSSADTVQPWLQKARDRLAAKAAVVRLQELLAARLGPASAPPPARPGVSPAPPPTNPAPPPTTSRAPS
jgi:hypothetical protein